jgi:hypothetical protein
VSVNGIDNVIVGTSTGDEPGLQEELAERKRRLEHLHHRFQGQGKEAAYRSHRFGDRERQDQVRPSFWSLGGRMGLLNPSVRHLPTAVSDLGKSWPR